MLKEEKEQLGDRKEFIYMAADHGAGQAVLPCKHERWHGEIKSLPGETEGSTRPFLPHTTSACRATPYCQVLRLPSVQHASFHLHGVFHLCSSILMPFKFSHSTYRPSASRATRRRKGSFVLPSPSVLAVSTLSLAARANCHSLNACFITTAQPLKEQPDSHKSFLGDDSSRWHVLVFLC